MRVLVTGGCGYKGAVLVPKLLAQGHSVRVFDMQWFGVNLEPHLNLVVCKGDIRDGVDCSDTDAIIHLAGIANDPCGELDAKLTWEVNVLATMRLADAARRAGVKKFIFASSASVYGIQGERAVCEDDPLAPVSDYNKTKMCAERVLLSYRSSMEVYIVRPATVCGMSPRMRLDTVVNMLTAQAVRSGKITMHCGAHGADLMRPNVHIQDITDLYCRLLAVPTWWPATLNANVDNLSVREIADLIRKETGAALDVTEVADKRSYRVSSALLRQTTGFQFRFGVVDAVREIVAAIQEGVLTPGDEHVNLTWMRKHGWVQG